MFPSTFGLACRDHRRGSCHQVSACGLGRFCCCRYLGHRGRRGASRDRVVASAHVSHQHAAIYLRGRNHVVEDLGSPNGTRLNGQLVTRPLRHGDRLSFAGVEAEFQLSVPQPVPPPRGIPPKGACHADNASRAVVAS